MSKDMERAAAYRHIILVTANSRLDPINYNFSLAYLSSGSLFRTKTFRWASCVQQIPYFDSSCMEFSSEAYNDLSFFFLAAKEQL